MRPRRLLTALSLSAAAMLACASPASAAAPSSYSATKLFGLDYKGNQQGLAYGDGYYYVGFDKSKDEARAIVQYDATGKKIRTVPLAIGHAAEIGYRRADGKLYVATGGKGVDTVINVVDLSARDPQLERPLTFPSLKGDGMVAVDNVRDQLVVFGGKTATHTIALVRFSDGVITSHFAVPDIGTPNGLEVVGDQILYLAHVDKRNVVAAFGLDGVPQSCVTLPVEGEAEGLAVDDATGQLFYGLRSPRSVSRVSPAWAGSLDHNVLVDGDAECGRSGTTNGGDRAIIGWTNVGKMSTVHYGSDKYPAAGSGPTGGGAAFFSGGDEDTATLTQVVPMTSWAKDVGTGRLTYTLGARLGGFGDQTDAAQVVVTFKDSSGATVGAGRIKPVTPLDRDGKTGLLPRSLTGVVPSTAASATVVVTATKDEGGNNDGYSDDISLVFTRP